MDAGGIGAFLQRAVVKTFSLPQLMPNTEQTQTINSQSDSMTGCWPQSPEAANLQPSHEGPFGTDNYELPNKRTRSSSVLDSSKRKKDAKISSTLPRDAAQSFCHDTKGNDYRRSLLDTNKEPDSRPDVERQRFEPQYFRKESSNVGVIREGRSSSPACHEQEAPQRLTSLAENDILDEDMCTDVLVHNTLFISGPTRTLTVNDDGKDRLAMLISEDMVATFNNIKKANKDIAKEARKLKAAEMENCDLRIDIEDVEARLGEVKDQGDTDEMKMELEEVQSKLQKNEKKIDAIKKGMRPYESNLQWATYEFQEFFEEILPAVPQDPREAQSFDGDLEMDSEPHAKQPSDTSSHSEDQSESEREKESESSLLSQEELLRRSATDDLEQSLWILMEAQAKFDNRHADYKQELANYYQLTAIGSVTYTRTDFDVYGIQHVQGLTKRLRDAEVQFEAAKSQAKALGLSIDPYDDNVFDDGYRESQEASIAPKVDRGRIEEWSAKVVSPGESEDFSEDDESVVVVDVWYSKPVDTTDSCSVVDFQGYGGDIKVWQTHCATLREHSIEPQQEDRWSLAPTSMRRRSV